MAIDARAAGPRVSRSSLVFAVHLALSVSVAMRARGNLIVVGNLVAFGARVFGVRSAGDDERVLEDGTQPRIGPVARFAACGKTGCRVTGIGCAVVIGQVALSAPVGDSRVIECGAQPRRGVMALLAAGGEIAGDMVGVGGTVVVG